MKTMNQSTAQIGYEIELDSSRYSETDIARRMKINFKEFIHNKKYNLSIKMSKEYYSSTIEFNFLKEKFTKNLHNKIKFFTKGVMKDYGLKVYWSSPSFVGTHIHFFRSNLHGEPTETILKIVMGFILENIDDLHLNSLQRIVTSHQLWGNYACNNTIIETILMDTLGLRFQYRENSASRPKYQPVIHSPRSRVGKLRSTEIRLIPTEFILNDKILVLLDRLSAMQDIPNKDIPTLYTELITHYKWLLDKKRTEKLARSDPSVESILPMRTGT